MRWGPAIASRVLGAAVLVFVLLPLQPILYGGDPGSPASHLGELARAYTIALWVGLGASVLVALPFAYAGMPARLERGLERLGALLRRPGETAFGIGLGVLAGTLTLALSWLVFGFQPPLHDAVAQLMDARYIASGRLSAPTLTLSEFFTFQQMVNLPSGWRSQYPPGYAILVAAGWWVGAPWAAGALLSAGTAVLTYRVALALDIDPLTARIGGVLSALSLFALAQAATFMSHTGAAFFGTLALFAALRRGHSVGWRLVVGLCIGLTFTIRPLAGVIAAAVAVAAILHAPREGGLLRRIPALLAVGAGALPALVLLGLHHLRAYGHPLTFGYVAAQGPGSGLGFHTDPWGYEYGLREGLGQLSGDLTALGLDLFVTPMSATVVIGFCLVLAAPSGRAWTLLLLWAFLPLAAHLFYWHQDFFLGPRLLADFHPAWALLTALSMRELLTWARAMENGKRAGIRWRSGFLAIFLVSGLSALVVLIPTRIHGWAGQWGIETRVPLPDPPEPGALVFVHGDWSERLGSRLAGEGLRVDVIRSAMRHNSSCRIQESLDRDGAVHELHFGPQPGPPLVEISLPTGTVLRTYPGEEPSARCEAEVRSDRFGTIPLPAVLWRGSLPGLPGDGPILARDLGPEENRRLISAHPWPALYVLTRTHMGGPLELVEYSEGMDLLWGVESAPSPAPGAVLESGITSGGP